MTRAVDYIKTILSSYAVSCLGVPFFAENRLETAVIIEDTQKWAQLRYIFRMRCILNGLIFP